ncbi:MAG: dockerin type I repeat-containing protein [Clostridia bacterium]|nr:dockerin type I repeat-containing protein [Clostridia bacterium]
MKRFTCLLLAMVLFTMGVSADWIVLGDYTTLNNPSAMLDYKIEHLLKDSVMFNTCDTITDGSTEIVANPNSSEFKMVEKSGVKTQGEGSVAFVKKYSDIADLPIIVRSSTAVDLADYQFVEFDLYMGGKWTFYTVSEKYESDYYTWIRFQNKWTNSVTDSTIASYDATWDFDPYELRSDSWTHVRMPIPKNAYGDCVQVTIHYSQYLFRGDKDCYVAIDNVQFTNDDADRPLTLEDKEAVMTMKAEMDAIYVAEQYPTPVNNKNLLNSWVKEIEAMEAALLTGDVDGDGTVAAQDALEVLKSVVGKATLTDTQKQKADVNGDTSVDAADALEILKIVVGK